MAGALSMAAGEYVSVSSQRDAEQADLRLEERELSRDPSGELRELAAIYEQRGLPPELASEVAATLSRRGALAAHARDELGLDAARLARPLPGCVDIGAVVLRGRGVAAVGRRGGAGDGARRAAIVLVTLIALGCWEISGRGWVARPGAPRRSASSSGAPWRWAITAGIGALVGTVTERRLLRKQPMAVDDGGGEVDQLAVGNARMLAQQLEGVRFVDAVTFHQNPLDAFDQRAAPERAFEVLVLGEAAQDDVDRALMCANTPRLDASLMNPGSRAWRRTITGQAASCTIRSINSSAC